MFASQSGNVPASQLDTNFTTCINAVNNAFLTGALSARPAASQTNGAYYFATDVNILYRDNGTTWTQVAAPGSLTTQQALTFASTVNWDMSKGGVGTLSPTSNFTMAAPTSIAAGSYYILLVTQDATGGRTITWNAVFKAPGSQNMPQPIQTANKTTPYLFVSPDGTNLNLVTIPQTISILAKSGAAIQTPNDTNEDILATVNVPANAIGLNGFLRLICAWTITNNGNNKTLRVRYSGISGTIYLSQALTNQQQIFSTVIIGNRNATNSQVGSQLTTTFTGALSASVSTSNVDTTQATTLLLTGQKGLSSDLLQLEYYTAELFYDGS